MRRLQASTLSQDITRRPKSAGNSSKCSTTKMRRKTAGGRVRPSISNGFPKAKSACLSAHWRLPGRSKSPEGSQGTVQACMRRNATQMTAGAKIIFSKFLCPPPRPASAATSQVVPSSSRRLWPSLQTALPLLLYTCFLSTI